MQLPPLIGSAISYIGYDCVAYFEPRTARDDMKDVLKVPESLFMLFDTIVAVDHFFQVVKVFTYVKVPNELTDAGAIATAYDAAESELRNVVRTISRPEVPLPYQGPITLKQEYTSNIGQAGYETHVT